MPRGRRKSGRSKEAVVEWIKIILRKRDWTATDLARRSALAPSTLLRALNDPEYRFVFSPRTLQKIAEGAGEPVPLNLRGRPSAPAAIAGSPILHYRMLEVRVVSALPAKVRTRGKPEGQETVVAPAKLENDETAFAFRNPDESLGAWFKPRCLMFATKARDPIGGDLVMLTGKDNRTRVRLLLGIDETGLSLSKTMPAKEDERIGFDDIEDVAVIVEVIMD